MECVDLNYLYFFMVEYLASYSVSVDKITKLLLKLTCF